MKVEADGDLHIAPSDVTLILAAVTMPACRRRQTFTFLWDEEANMISSFAIVTRWLVHS